MGRSNMFANVENQFKYADKEELTEMAYDSLGQLIIGLQEADFETQMTVNTAMLAASLGIVGDGKLKEAEKEMIDNTFCTIFDEAPSEYFYDNIAMPVTNEDFKLVELLTKMGNDIAMPFIHIVLAFGYADGVFEDEIAEKLDPIFGMNFMVDFFDSGLEEVPAPQVRLTGLEAEIVQWLKSDDQLRPLDDYVEHFSGHSRNEIKNALDSLCDKGILYGGDQIIMNMYGLA